MEGAIITGEYCLGGHYSPQYQVSEFMTTTMHPNKPDHKDQELACTKGNRLQQIPITWLIRWGHLFAGNRINQINNIKSLYTLKNIFDYITSTAQINVAHII